MDDATLTDLFLSQTAILGQLAQVMDRMAANHDAHFTRLGEILATMEANRARQDEILLGMQAHQMRQDEILARIDEHTTMIAQILSRFGQSRNGHEGEAS